MKKKEYITDIDSNLWFIHEITHKLLNEESEEVFQSLIDYFAENQARSLEDVIQNYPSFFSKGVQYSREGIDLVPGGDLDFVIAETISDTIISFLIAKRVKELMINVYIKNKID